MKSVLLFVFISIQVIVSQAFSQEFIVQRGDSAQLFNSFDSAYAYAQDNDFIYLPPGQINGTKIIDKKLHIFGAGSMQDSLLAHQVTSIDKLVLKHNSSYSTFSGFYIKGSVSCGDSIVNNIVFENMRLSPNNSSQILTREPNITGQLEYKYFYFKNCFFDRARLHLSDFSHFQFTNCIFHCGISGANYCTFINNLIIGYYANWTITRSMQYHSNSIFKNNIVRISSNDEGGNFYQNNIGIGPLSTRVYLPTGEVFSDVFEHYTSSGGAYNFATYTDSTNYEIKSTSVAKNAGVDGTDLGIFGGFYPFKFGVGRNPLYKKFIIGTGTNNQGELQIEIKVKAQNN